MKSATAEKLWPAEAGARDEVAEATSIPSPRTPLAITRNIASGLFKQTANLLASDGERERTQRDAILAFAVRVLSAGLLYLTQIVLARWMGGSEYGIYVAVWTWVLILGAMSHLGLNLASIRLAPSYRETNDFKHLRGLIWGVRILALGSGTIVMLLGVLGVWLLSNRIEPHFVLPIYLALVCIPLYALTDVQDGIGRGNGWMSIALVPPYVLRPLLLLGSMFAANRAGLPMNAATAAGGAIVATWLAGLFQTLSINRRVSATIPVAVRETDFRSWLTISAPLLVILTAELLLQNTDILVVSRFMAPADVGIYFAAGKTMALIMFVHYAVGSAVAHKFAAFHARGDHVGLRTFVRDSVNWTFWPSFAGALAILALGMPLLSLFGPGFGAGYPVMFILVVGFLFRSAMGPAEFLLNMLGEQKLCATVLFSAAMLNIALNVALVPYFGMIGAATATAFSLIAAASLNALVVWRRLGIQMPIWNNLPKL
ncbi:lipopolysaccharide biosynthesis protein [Hyphomicrobium sp. 99]|uniref:lipopolysaccharide biosynthesis protein n=1 Tax=Hyphomicrobium sp. 99 TaxID=1163419 RepID=UPI0009E22BBA|nr:lipopolysaccharide biosynthesis protein [Hyphomicrobium sp. 99]